LAKTELDFSFSSEFSGISEKHGLRLHNPTMVALQKYLMFFPDPANSVKYFIFQIDKLMTPPYALIQPSKQPISLPNIMPPIHPDIQIIRAKQDQFNILVP
jgi:hypothetical protein